MDQSSCCDVFNFNFWKERAVLVVNNNRRQGHNTNEEDKVFCMCFSPITCILDLAPDKDLSFKSKKGLFNNVFLQPN